MLTAPNYVVNTGISSRAVDYDWTLGGGREVYNRTNNRLSTRLNDLAPRALLALSTGITEWIIWRLQGLGELPEAVQFVTAAWAGVIDFRYFKSRWQLKDRDLSTPILQPQRDALTLLGKAFIAANLKSTFFNEATYLTFLANHILKKNKAFAAWLEQNLSSLTETFPKSDATRQYDSESVHTAEEEEAYDWGLPVPREALDPSSGFTMADRPQLIDRFLRSLKPQENPYLRSADEMRASSFAGIPYTYTESA